MEQEKLEEAKKFLQEDREKFRKLIDDSEKNYKKVQEDVKIKQIEKSKLMKELEIL